MNKNLKRILLTIVLMAVIAGIVLVIVNASYGKKEAKKPNTNDPKNSKNVIANVENSVEVETTKKELLPVVEEKTEEGGTIYKLREDITNPEVVLKDNYFDTTISDININFSQYEGKTVEIEGLYFKNPQADYTFVGRYSLSNLCADCPQGYSYFEYEWDGETKLNLKDEEDWIKVLGTFRRGYDEKIQEEYYYIEIASLEVKPEKGLITVSN